MASLLPKTDRGDGVGNRLFLEEACPDPAPDFGNWEQRVLDRLYQPKADLTACDANGDRALGRRVGGSVKGVEIALTIMQSA
jgi:hypothetical protein